MVLVSPFTDYATVNKAQLDVLVAEINANASAAAAAATAAAAAAAAAANAGLFLGERNGVDDVVLTTASHYYAYASAFQTFTLATTRRVRIYMSVQIVPTLAASSHYYAHGGWNAGSSVGTPTLIGASATGFQTSSNLGQTVTHEGTVLLTAGTYTAYGCLQRTVGGSATDFMTSGYIAVYDVGPS